MYTVGVTGKFSAIHALVGDFGEETIPHSHPYRLEWDFEIESLDENGFSLDISRLIAARDRLFSELNGKNLNKDPFFRDIQTSLENLCVYIANELLETLAPGPAELKRISRMNVRVWETEDAWAGYQKVFKQEYA